MRLALLVAVATLGCGGSRPASHTAPPAVAPAYPATRWVPAHPTYVLASPSVKEAQRGIRDVIDALGVVVGVDAGEISRELQQLLAIDALSPEAVAAAGVDLEGGIAMFSEAVAPTFVVHLSAPGQTQAFFERQRERGLVTQSVIVDGTEVFTAQLLANVKVSWAVAGDWLWIHFTPPFAPADATAWFTNSHAPDGAGWARDWTWAQQSSGLARPGSVLGFLDARELVGRAVARVPEAVACAKLVEPIGRVAISLDGEGPRVTGRFVLDLGPAATGVAAAILPIPEGFAAAAQGAPLAAQWNLDLPTARAWLQPCLAALGEDLAWLDRFGVRSGRGVLQRFDPDDKRGAGAVLLELVHKAFFASQLDDIPMRSALERSRRYGPHAGHSLSVPFVATIDYVLTDKLALAAVGEGLLTRIVGSGGGVAGPLASVELSPLAMSAEAWTTILGALQVPEAARMVDRLVRWRAGHVAITVEGTSLVLTASGTRR